MDENNDTNSITIFDLYRNHVGNRLYCDYGYNKIEDIEESVHKTLFQNVYPEESPYINNRVYIIIKIMIPISIMFSICFVLYWFYT